MRCSFPILKSKRYITCVLILLVNNEEFRFTDLLFVKVFTFSCNTIIPRQLSCMFISLYQIFSSCFSISSIIFIILVMKIAVFNLWWAMSINNGKYSIIFLVDYFKWIRWSAKVGSDLVHCSAEWWNNYNPIKFFWFNLSYYSRSWCIDDDIVKEEWQG